MQITELEAEVRELMHGIEHPRTGAALALAEECGEVMRCILDGEYYGKDVDAELRAELGDVLITLCEVCARFEISLEECARGALDKLRREAPRWREELGDRLRDLRRKQDGP